MLIELLYLNWLKWFYLNSYSQRNRLKVMVNVASSYSHQRKDLKWYKKWGTMRAKGGQKQKEEKATKAGK